MVKKIKVLFVLPELSAGGAERILSFMAENISEDRFNSHLLVVGMSTVQAYEIASDKVTFLNKKRVLHGIPSILWFIIKSKPKVVVSTLHLNILFGLVAPFFFRKKFVIREASVASVMSKYYDGNKLLDKLSKIAYKNVDGIICQSKDMAKDFLEVYHADPKKLKIINNPITKLFPVKEKSPDEKVKNLVTVGRLSKEKGHLRVLDVLSSVDFPFQYTIVGEGPFKETIFEHAKNLGLENKIKHIPFTKNIGEVLAENDLFLQGSFVEGFPNAVLESCVVGTPVVAFNVPGGTKEIIQNGINGYLANDLRDYERMILQASTQKWNPRIISESVKDKFSTAKIIKEYENLFTDLTYQ